MSHISSYDCNFQQFAVTFRITTAKSLNLQSYLKLMKLSAAHTLHPAIGKPEETYRLELLVIMQF